MSAPKVTAASGPPLAKPPAGPGDSARKRDTARRTPNMLQSTLEAGAMLRLGLQLRSRTNLRRHWRRASLRIAVLIGADLAVFFALRAIVRSVRDVAMFGDWLAMLVQSVIPRGYLTGWQYALGLILAMSVTGNYHAGTGRRDPGRMLSGVALGTALSLWASMWDHGIETFAVQFLMTVTMVWTALFIERMSVNKIVRFVRPPGTNAVPTLFVGSQRACRTAVRARGFALENEYRNVGYVATDAVAPADALGRIEQFPWLLHDSGAECVVISGDLSDEQFHHVVEASFAAGCQVLALSRLLALENVDPSVIWRGGQPVFQLMRPELRASQLIMKRMIDIIGSSIGLLFLSPILLLVGTLVKLDSDGPAFFRQTRVGRGGRLFSIIKFRSMVADAESKRDELQSTSIYKDDRLFKMPDDPRVTRLGRLLRRTSLDELPQLFNVLMGDMSLVGPRPPLPSEVSKYEEHHFCRFDVKPGITGPWQVSGRNEVKDFEQVMLIESAYIRHWNLATDIAILLRTVPVVLKMRGAH